MAPSLTATRRCCRDGPHLQPEGFGMIATGLRVHSAWEAGAWTLAMNSVALRWRVAPELLAATVIRLLGPSPCGVASA
jgi:hypothetical protein